MVEVKAIKKIIYKGRKLPIGKRFFMDKKLAESYITLGVIELIPELIKETKQEIITKEYKQDFENKELVEDSVSYDSDSEVKKRGRKKSK